MSKDNSEPAFPMAVDCSVGSRTEYQIGMSIRDYFAAAALQGLCACEGTSGTSEGYAAKAYELADAMIAEMGK